MARIISYTTAEVLGTAGNDTIISKGLSTAFFGGAGNDTILTGVNTTRDIIYGGISVPDTLGGYYGHPMPKGTLASFRAVWAHDGNDTGHGGDGDWMELGSDADDFIWHPRPGGYTAPGINRGFNPDEGDVLIFAHDEGFTVDRVLGSKAGSHWNILSADLHGHDSDALLDGEWMRLDFRTDRRGPGVDPFTGAGDHRMLIPVVTGDMTADAMAWLRAHDAGFYSPDAHDGWIF